MAPRTNQSRRGGRRTGGDATTTTTLRPTGAEWEALQAAKAEAERRERILEDRRRTDAKWRPKVPEVRRLVSFEAFKNRFHSPEARDHAVEVLYAPAGSTAAAPNLQAQIRREQTTRRKEEVARSRQKWSSAGAGGGAYGYGGGYGGDGGYGYGGYGYETAASYMPKKSAGDDKVVKSDKKLTADASQLHDAHMQRIRIQSQAVLGHLTSLMNETERRSTPRTFIRPFKPLIYFQPKMKEILAMLEEKWGDVEGLEELEDDVVDSEHSTKTPPSEELEIVEPVEQAKDGDDASQSGDDDDDEEDDRQSLQSVDSNAEEQELLMDGVEALRDMRCYVEFVDNEVMPLYTQVCPHDFPTGIC